MAHTGGMTDVGVQHGISLLASVNKSLLKQCVVTVQSMKEANMTESFVDVVVIYPSVTLLTAQLLHTTLPSQPAALQALYNTRKKLSATQWHFYGMEHLLPVPFFVGHPGMGATLQTFYRKKKESDNGHIALTNAADSGRAWKVGQVR
jgi:hypothetical protein